MRCLDAVPEVPGVIFTLTCSVATASLSVFGVRSHARTFISRTFWRVRDKDFHSKSIECPLKCFCFVFLGQIT